MSTVDQQMRKIYSYIDSFSTPVEADFFKPEQLRILEAESAKLQSSRDYVAAIIEKDDFDERIQKAVVEGKILSGSQVQAIREKHRALEDLDGVRVECQETLVSPSGERIIMSPRLSGIIGLSGDTYVLKGEQAKLVSGLQSEGVPGPLVDKVVASLNKNGAVVLQDGVFLALKPLLEESLGRTLSSFNKATSQVVPPAPVAVPTGNTSQLPFGFIEYLKNTDKEYDRVEHEVVNDKVFQEFFTGLQKQYAYYKTMPVERMAGEVMIRPQLWNRLSTQTRVWVQNIVTRNRDEFMGKVKQVAQAVHLEKLDEIKKAIAK